MSISRWMDKKAVVHIHNEIFSSVAQSCSTFAILWTAARQASLSITNSWSLLKLMSIESVMPSNHLNSCHPLLLPPSIFLSIRVFSSESVLCIRWPKDWTFSYSISPSFSSVQALSHVRLFVTPWIAARQASLSTTNSWSSLRLTSIESVMPSSHLILRRDQEFSFQSHVIERDKKDKLEEIKGT